MSFFTDLVHQFYEKRDELKHLLGVHSNLSPLMTLYRDYVYQQLLRLDTSSPVILNALPRQSSSSIHTNDCVLSLTTLQRTSSTTVNKGLIASGHANSGIQIWDTTNERQVRVFAHNKTTQVLKMQNIRILEQMQGSNNNHLLICACDNFNGFVVYNWHTGKLANVIYTKSPICMGRRNLLAFGDKYVIAGSEDKLLTIWDITTRAGNIVQQISAADSDFESPFFCIEAFLHSRILCGSLDGSLQVWNLNTSRRDVHINAHKRSIRSIALIDDTRFATGSFDRTIRVWGISFRNNVNITCLAVLLGHGDSIKQMTVFGKNWLVSASDDSTMRVWNINKSGNYECVRLYKDHKMLVLALVTLSHSTFISGSYDRDIRIWSTNESQIFTKIYRCQTEDLLCDITIHANIQEIR
jgi:hypothetical protein